MVLAQTDAPGTLVRGEYFLGLIDPGEGQGYEVLALDGQWDEAVEEALRDKLTWPAVDMPTLLNLRVQDAQGNWGPLWKKPLFAQGEGLAPTLAVASNDGVVCPGDSVFFNYVGPPRATIAPFVVDAQIHVVVLMVGRATVDEGVADPKL